MAEVIYEKTREYLRQLERTPEGKSLLGKFDQDIGFEVLDEGNFVVSIKDGKLNFRRGDAPVPASNLEEFNQNMKVIGEKDTFLKMYEGKLRPVDALCPDLELEEGTLLNIHPYLPKLGYVDWICDIIKLIARQNLQKSCGEMSSFNGYTLTKE